MHPLKSLSCRTKTKAIIINVGIWIGKAHDMTLWINSKLLKRIIIQKN